MSAHIHAGARVDGADGADAFEPPLLAADLREVATVYGTLRPHVGTARWYAVTRRSDWSMRRTVAHLDVMATTGSAAVDAALEGRRFVLDGIARRRGLDEWNERTSADRLRDGDDLLDTFLRRLDTTADRVEQLSPEQLAVTVELPIYNAPMAVVDLLGILALHPGLTHSAQVVDAVDRPPLWAALQPATRTRMITRLARALGYLYWPERGGAHGVAVAFAIGRGGDRWHVVGTRDGAEGGMGAPNEPDLTLWFRDVGVACRMFTGRLPMLRSLLRRDLRLRGDVRVLRRFGTLFSADG